MDRKSIIIVGICIILFFSWNTLLQKFNLLPPPKPVSTNTVATGNAQGTNATTGMGATSGVTPTGGTTANPPSQFAVNTNAPEQLLVLTNGNARYTFTSRGGGLQEVELVGYPETVHTRRRLEGHPTNQWATLNAPEVPPLFALLGDESLQGDGVYKLTQNGNGVRAEKTLPNGLTVVKDFQLSTNFLVTATTRLENHTGHEIVIPSYEWSTGTSTPMNPQDNGLAQLVLWFNGSKAEQVGLPFFNTNTSKLFGLMSRVPETEYRAGTSNVVWSSAQNQFFAMATMPDKPAEAVVVHMIDLPAPTSEELKDYPNAVRNPRGLESALVYPGLKLAPGAVATSQFNVFAGPKEYQTLAQLAARFNNELDLVMNFGWSITSPIAKALLVTMNWVHHSTLLPYGWIIILTTIFLKAIFWPLTAASTRSAKRMQALQPQLKALQEKYKDEPQKFAQKQWEFYKKNKVNPMSGCLPMLLQVPVFIGFYGMLRTAIELRGAPFLWIGDLSKPDTVLSVPLHWLGLGDSFFPINPLPLIMGVTMLWQARMTPMSPSMDPQQQKMMKYMPLFMLVFMYNLSSGLALYWTTNNLLTILQTRLTKAQPNTTAPEPAKPAAAVAPQKKKK